MKIQYFMLASAMLSVILNGFILGTFLPVILSMPWQGLWVVAIFTGANVVNAFFVWRHSQCQP